MNNLDLTRILEHQGIPKAGPYSDIVFSSKVRLIRNANGIPFSYRQRDNDVKLIKAGAEKFMKESVYKGLEMVSIDSLDNNSKRFLRERNIISIRMETEVNSHVIISKGEDFVIMVNDEDHFKIQIIRPGFALRDAYYKADEIDNELNKFVIYAFSEYLGYITSNPSGGGLSLSITLHLPVLYFTKRLIEVQNLLKLSHMTIEGIRKEGIKTIGSMFILSNNFSINIPETDIMDEAEKITMKIINLESEARENYFTEHGIKLEDRICRSFGLLKNAKRMNYVEAMDNLSDIRLGVILSVIKNIELYKIDDLMVNMQWSHMQNIAGRIFNDTSDGDIFRASYLRDQLEWSTIYG